jgi:hypothetical protein
LISLISANLELDLTPQLGETIVKKEILALLAISAIGQAASAQNDRYADMRKAAVELPTARLLRSTDTAATRAIAADSSQRVQPGLVAWHANYQEAVDASRASGKPVLLVQLLGRMDEKFC